MRTKVLARVRGGGISRLLQENGYAKSILLVQPGYNVIIFAQKQ